LKFKAFGWNGILFEVQEDMRFSRQGGNAKSGHVMLEAEEHVVEARWDTVIRKKSRPLSDVTESLIKQMKGKSKKQEVSILKQEEAYVSTHKAMYMIPKSEIEERLYVWYCEESERLVILRFVFKVFDETAKTLMRRAIETMECHREKASTWSVMNLQFETPGTFLLTDTKIAVGRAHFMLTDRKQSAFSDKLWRILIEYFSMANVVFKDSYRDLNKWFEQNYQKDLRKMVRIRKFKFESPEPGSIRRHKTNIRQGVDNSGFSWRKTTVISNASWYCSGMNRIYSVTVLSTLSRPAFFKRVLDEEEHGKLLGNLLASFKCH